MNTQHRLPFARHWGDGSTSSSDSWFFTSGGQKDLGSQANGRYGSEPGVTFYSHLSDHYAPFYSRVQALSAQAAEAGIRIVPLAFSGVGKDTEFSLRFLATATGSSYTFLTNDSGIGNDKIESTTGDYQVEFLNDLLVRIVNRVDAYIAHQTEEAQPTLEELRELIKSTVPEAEEKLWYGVPFYNFHGELVGLAAYRRHVSFGVGAAALQSEDRKQLEEKGYKTGKGTVQIRYNQEVPTQEVKRLLKAKVKMNKGKEQ